MKVKTVRQLTGPQCAQFPDGIKPVGTVIDHPDAYWLVRMGAAVPADDEATKAAGINDQQMAAAQRGFDRVAAGIHPDDYEAFEAGEMVGYYPDGSSIPGPNAEETEGGIYIP